MRDLGDRRFNVVERRDRQRAHDDGLPWIVASGPPITSTGGHCHCLGGEVATPAEIVAAVRERVDRGVDIVKVMASGGDEHARHGRGRGPVLVEHCACSSTRPTGPGSR